MAPCGRGVEPSAPRTARDGRLRDRGQRPGPKILGQQIRQRGACAVACCTLSSVRRCRTPLPLAASTPPTTRSGPLPRAYSAQIGAPASSAASHQISSPFTCTSCPHACDAASCMPRATSWLCLPPSDPVTMPSCCRYLHLHFALCDIPLPLYFIGRKFLRAPRAWLHFSVRGDAIATRCRAKLVAAISSYNYQLR